MSDIIDEYKKKRTHILLDSLRDDILQEICSIRKIMNRRISNKEMEDLIVHIVYKQSSDFKIFSRMSDLISSKDERVLEAIKEYFGKLLSFLGIEPMARALTTLAIKKKTWENSKKNK